VQTTLGFYTLPGGTATTSRRLAALTATSVLNSMAPAVICDVARVAGVSAANVKVVTVRLLESNTGAYAATAVSTAAFPNTITDADCTTISNGGSVSAPAGRRLQSTSTQPLLSFTTLVLVPTTVTSSTGGTTTASAAELVAAASAVQSKISAALASNAVTTASDGSLNLGAFTAATSAWLTTNSYSVAVTSSGSAVVTDPSGTTVTAATIAAVVGGQTSAGGLAVNQAQSDVASAAATASHEAAVKNSVRVIVGATIGTGAFVALALIGAVWVWHARREREMKRAEAALAAAYGTEPAAEATTTAAAASDVHLMEAGTPVAAAEVAPAAAATVDSPATTRFLRLQEPSPIAAVKPPSPAVNSSRAFLSGESAEEAASEASELDKLKSALGAAAPAAAEAPAAPARRGSTSLAALAITANNLSRITEASSSTASMLPRGHVYSASAASDARAEELDVAPGSALSPHMPAGGKAFAELEEGTPVAAKAAAPERPPLHKVSGPGAVHRRNATDEVLATAGGGGLHAAGSMGDVMGTPDPSMLMMTARGSASSGDESGPAGAMSARSPRVGAAQLTRAPDV
jgi:hypothetical protein